MPRGRHWPGAGRRPSRPIGRWEGQAMRSTSLDAALALDESDDGNVTPVTMLRVARPLPSDWALLPMDCEERSQYSVRFCDSLLGDDSTVLQEAMDDRKALLVTTPAVDRMYGAAMRAALNKTNTVSMLVLNAREETK